MRSAGIHFTLEEISETKSLADMNMIRIQQAPVPNRAPGELITINLIDKVGLQSSTSSE
jgi:hypothetical protein